MRRDLLTENPDQPSIKSEHSFSCLRLINIIKVRGNFGTEIKTRGYLFIRRIGGNEQVIIISHQYIFILTNIKKSYF